MQSLVFPFASLSLKKHKKAELHLQGGKLHDNKQLLREWKKTKKR